MSTDGKQRDARAIAHHYDVSNDFYELFLDPLMVYTCGYYRDPDGKLERAQEDKLDLVCRKLRLSRARACSTSAAGGADSASGRPSTTASERTASRCRRRRPTGRRRGSRARA